MLQSILKLRAMLDAGQITAAELIRTALTLCKQGDIPFDPLLEQWALERAAYADSRIGQSSTRPLTGLPLALDTGCLSMQAKGDDKNATLVKKLSRYGAAIVGETVEPALAVQEGRVVAALSVHPLARARGTNVAALRPSFGTVSRYGALGDDPESLQIGILAPSALSLAIVMDAISDYDPYDPLMVQPNCYDYAQLIGKSLSNLSIGLCCPPTDQIAALGCVMGPAPLPDPDAHPDKTAINTYLDNLLNQWDALLLPNTDQTIALVTLSGLPAAVLPADQLILTRRYQETVALQIAAAVEGMEGGERGGDEA